MACVLQIGAGGVGGVVAHKMAMNRESFTLCCKFKIPRKWVL